MAPTSVSLAARGLGCADASGVARRLKPRGLFLRRNDFDSQALQVRELNRLVLERLTWLRCHERPSPRTLDRLQHVLDVRVPKAEVVLPATASRKRKYQRGVIRRLHQLHHHRVCPLQEGDAHLLPSVGDRVRGRRIAERLRPDLHPFLQRSHHDAHMLQDHFLPTASALALHWHRLPSLMMTCRQPHDKRRVDLRKFWTFQFARG